MSIELLGVYVSDVERQILKAISDYNSGAATALVESEDPEDSGRIVTHYKGLDDTTWDLRTIFIEYFPNLQRKSALITLFSFFEHELDELCRRIRLQEQILIELSDFAGRGIDRSTNYLMKAGGFTDIRSPREWNEIKKIQMVRNLVVHAEGKLPNPEDSNKRAIAKYVRDCPYLDGETDVVLHPGFLEHFVKTVSAYFERIDAEITKRYRT